MSTDLTAAIEAADLMFFPAHQEPDELTRARFANAIAAAAELIVADTRRQIAEEIAAYRNRAYLTSEAKRALWQAIRIADDKTAIVIRAENAAIARGGDSGTEESR